MKTFEMPGRILTSNNVKYTHAWGIMENGVTRVYGFAGSKELAMKASDVKLRQAKHFLKDSGKVVTSIVVEGK